MKLQGLSIIFGLIVIPMVLVLSYYIQLQVDTITLQTAYDSKLLDATHDAMVTFELNTANEDLSSVADSLRSIIDASNNIFMNTLATNMGLSNASISYLEPYVPAILYTLYDGYYISSPTRVPEIAVTEGGVALEIASKSDEPTKFSIAGLRYNGTEYTYNSEDTNYYSLGALGTVGAVPATDYGELLYKKKNGNYTTNINDKDISYKTEHVLKSYVPYSAKYVVNGKDVTINYTLDNYLTIVANNIDGKSYSKSGYLINPKLVTSAKIGTEDLLKYNENDLEERIKTALNAGQEVSLRLNVVKDDSVNPPLYTNIDIKTTDINSDEADAIIYYSKAKVFSEWVYDNLSDLEEQHIIENTSEIIGETLNHEEEVVYTFDRKNNKIFNINENPESNSSIFISHKFQVIRNTIQYNLNLAMSVYNSETPNVDADFNMPVISNTEWDKIINNISIVSFMQGVKCGLKTYNNYALVSSTNNEVMVTLDEIYYIRKSEFNNSSGTYHRIDCPELKKYLNNLNPSADKTLTSFVSKEVKYDKIYDKNNDSTMPYEYDHKNLACYTCIVDGNYIPESLDDLKLKAYYVGTGKERYNVYKMNAIQYSEGYRIIYDSENGGINFAPSINLADIKKIEITFGHVIANNFEEATVQFSFDGMNLLNNEFILTTNQTKEQTITLQVNPQATSGATSASGILGNLKLTSDSTTVDITQLRSAIKLIKIIYK